MLFSSFEFVCLFLPVVVIGSYLAGRIGRRPAILWLVVASLFFYGWWNPVYVFLILGSISVNYLVGRQFARVTGPAASWLLAFGVVSRLPCPDASGDRGGLGVFPGGQFLSRAEHGKRDREQAWPAGDTGA